MSSEFPSALSPEQEAQEFIRTAYASSPEQVSPLLGDDMAMQIAKLAHRPDDNYPARYIDALISETAHSLDDLRLPPDTQAAMYAISVIGFGALEESKDPDVVRQVIGVEKRETADSTLLRIGALLYHGAVDDVTKVITRYRRDNPMTLGLNVFDESVINTSARVASTIGSVFAAENNRASQR